VSRPAGAFSPEPPRVAIVGGGLAGLATAVALADRGLRLTLLESRPRLGGRASSFPDPTTGKLIDNCQHISMGCCTNLADFCRRVGIRDRFRVDRAFVMIGPDGALSRFRPGPLPAPLHYAGSFLKARHLTTGDKLRIGGALALLRWARPGPEPLGAWLRRHGQNDRTIALFWDPVVESALNVPCARADLSHAKKLFLDGFLAHRDGFNLEIPTAPLGELYGTHMERWLPRHGVGLRLKAGVDRVTLEAEGSVSGVSLRDGEHLPADIVVLAVPFGRVAGLLAEGAPGREPALGGGPRMAPSPITGLHLWFDRPVCPYPHASLLGRTVQWVFDHSAITGAAAGPDGGQHLQIVISASDRLARLRNEEVRDLALRDLEAVWPATAAATLRHWRVVTEHAATFSPEPGIERLRPSQRTAIDGLYLAGDWTATGWPSTMEGAVRSGYLAAEAILETLGTPARLLRPDLPRGLLARLLLGPPTAMGADAEPAPAPPVARPAVVTPRS
jgi:squalene-associated FAD-dependent desaturase